MTTRAVSTRRGALACMSSVYQKMFPIHSMPHDLSNTHTAGKNVSVRERSSRVIVLYVSYKISFIYEIDIIVAITTRNE